VGGSARGGEVRDARKDAGGVVVDLVGAGTGTAMGKSAAVAGRTWATLGGRYLKTIGR